MLDNKNRIITEMVDVCPGYSSIKEIHKPTLDKLYKYGYVLKEDYENLVYNMRIKAIKESKITEGVDFNTVLSLYKSGHLAMDAIKKLMSDPSVKIDEPKPGTTSTTTEDSEDLERDEDEQEIITEDYSELLSKYNLDAEALGSIISMIKRGRTEKAIAHSFNLPIETIQDISAHISLD